MQQDRKQDSYVVLVTFCLCNRLVILDAEDSWAPELLEAGIIDKFYVTDLSDQDTVFDNCMAGIRKAERVLPHPFPPWINPAFGSSP